MACDTLQNGVTNRRAGINKKTPQSMNDQLDKNLVSSPSKSVTCFSWYETCLLAQRAKHRLIVFQMLKLDGPNKLVMNQCMQLQTTWPFSCA
jgi:hypothetical protein